MSVKTIFIHNLLNYDGNKFPESTYDLPKHLHHFSTLLIVNNLFPNNHNNYNVDVYNTVRNNDNIINFYDDKITFPIVVIPIPEDKSDSTLYINNVKHVKPFGTIYYIYEKSSIICSRCEYFYNNKPSTTWKHPIYEEYFYISSSRHQIRHTINLSRDRLSLYYYFDLFNYDNIYKMYIDVSNKSNLIMNEPSKVTNNDTVALFIVILIRILCDEFYYNNIIQTMKTKLITIPYTNIDGLYIYLIDIIRKYITKYNIKPIIKYDIKYLMKKYKFLNNLYSVIDGSTFNFTTILGMILNKKILVITNYKKYNQDMMDDLQNFDRYPNFYFFNKYNKIPIKYDYNSETIIKLCNTFFIKELNIDNVDIDYIELFNYIKTNKYIHKVVIRHKYINNMMYIRIMADAVAANPNITTFIIDDLPKDDFEDTEKRDGHDIYLNEIDKYVNSIDYVNFIDKFIDIFYENLKMYKNKTLTSLILESYKYVKNNEKYYRKNNIDIYDSINDKFEIIKNETGVQEYVYEKIKDVTGWRKEEYYYR
jgi:hypothetical protein